MNRKLLFVLIFIIFLLEGVSIFAQGLSIQYFCGEAATSTQNMKPRFRVLNNSGSTVPLSELTVRYYRVKEGTAGETAYIDWAQVGGSNITKSYSTDYIEFGFTSGAGNLVNGGNSGEVQPRICKSDWTNYDQSNDYSFSPSITSYTSYTKMTLHRNGTLVFGTVPGGSGATPTPVASTPTPVTTTAPPTPTAVPATPTPGSGGGTGQILRQWWINIEGNYIADLTTHPSYPASPAGSSFVTSMEVPSDINNNYGTRLIGYLHPSVSGSYKFYIASDDHGELWLSSDNTEANKQLIASVSGWTSSREFNKYSSQTSANISLSAGATYFIEAIMKEGVGGDNLSVAWLPPGGSQAIIPGSYLSPYDPATAPTPTVSPTPAPTNPPTATPTAPPGGLSYVWVEAEDSAAFYPEVVKSDTLRDQSSSTEASHGIYLGVAGADSSTSYAPSKGHMNFDISGISGVNKIWARVSGPWSGSVKFWQRIDNGSWTHWMPPVYGNWQWAQVLQADLTGKNVFTLAFSENRAMLDKVLFTTDLSYVPTGLGGDALGSYTPVTYTSSAVATYGQLKVVGRQLCDANNNPVQLRGFSTHGIQWYPLKKDRTIAAAAQSFPFNAANKTGLSVIRLANYVENFWTPDDFWNGYLADPAPRMQVVKDLIDDAIAAGIYVMVDWHIHQNPVDNKFNGFNPQNPSDGLEEAAYDFFQELSIYYGNTANIIWEIVNEPVGADWNLHIKPYAQNMISMIRQNSSNIIIVGTPNYSQGVDIASQSPITGYSNIMYTLHFYAASHYSDIQGKLVTAMNNNLPVFVTEFGTSDYAVSTNDWNNSNKWFNDYLNPYFISWVNWSLSPKDEKSSVLNPGVSMAGPWDNDDLTQSGKYIRDRLLAVVSAP